jgi:hypothetical protein
MVYQLTTFFSVATNVQVNPDPDTEPDPESGTGPVIQDYEYADPYGSTTLV